ncbi:MAG: CAP domain-containing protein [Anaerolineales bacterium]
MRNLALALVIFLAVLPAPVAAGPSAAPPSQGSASEVIALINDYRAQNGLYALEQESTLMSLAQGHSGYQASIKQVTHGGPGGSRPKDRAYAAGYGNGQIIFISELITGGFEQDSQGALTWWKNSPEHNSYLLSSNYFEIGVGVATDEEGRSYYTAELGIINTGTTYVPESGAAAPSEPQEVMIPVVKAEPRDNGALVHIVRQGQALWTIAAVYEVPLEQLFELNNLNAYSFIFPDDEIIIEPEGSLPTSTPKAAQNPTSDPTSKAAEELLTTTPRSSSESLAAAAEVTLAPTPPPPVAEVPQLTAAEQSQASNTTVYLIVGVALVSIIGVFAASFFIQRPRPPAPPDNDPFAPID